MILLLALLLALGPDGPDSLRQQGTALLAERDTLGAIAAMDASVSGAWTNPDVLLTLGRLHVARGEAGPAVLALERASRLAPTDAEVAGARREAYALAGQVAPDVPPPFVASRSVSSRIGAGVLVGLALVLYLVAAVLGLAWWRRRRPAAGWAAVAIAPFALVTLVLAGLALWDASGTQGIVLTTVELRALPTPEAGTVGHVREGEVTATGSASGEWREVQAGDLSGWVPSHALAQL